VASRDTIGGARGSRGRPATPAHRIQYALFLALAWSVRWMPESMALALGSSLGWVAGSLLRIRRGVVAENLRLAFPDGDARWRRRTAARAYRHVGRQGVILLRLARMGPDAVRERTRVSGIEHVREALDRGQGVVLVTGHLGNWEVGGASLTVRDVALDVVARRQSNPYFDAHLRRTRERLGMRVIYRHEASRAILKSLRAGGAVALVADQNVKVGGIFVDFFGVPAATARGPALLALRAGARIVAAAATSLPDSPGHFRVTIRPLPVPGTDDPEEAARLLTRDYLAALEDQIREAPEQYFWLHRRWKTRPAQEQAAGGPQEPGGSATV
jgi:Kdo2-lipid IVA lauroyltransferase/acyltransferase